MTQRYIGVIGSGENVPVDVLSASEQVGRSIAEKGAILVCGGRGGVMEAACRGAKSAGGITVGILPGLTRQDANEFVDVAIPTGLGYSLRNFITVRCSDAIIMLHGEVGTLSEAVLSYQHGKPLIALTTTDGWARRLRETALEDGAYLDGRRLMQIRYVETAEDAVEMAISSAKTAQAPSKI